MGAASTTDLVLSAASDFSFGALAILAVVIGIGVALFVFRWGWNQLKNGGIETKNYLFDIHGDGSFHRHRKGVPDD